MKDYSFGNFLHELRERRGLSQYQLGKLVGVSNKAVSKWENGAAKPQIHTLVRLSEILGVSVDELLACKYRTFEEKEEVFAIKKELWNKAQLKLNELYGSMPPIDVVSRFYSERAELEDSDLILVFGILSEVMKEAKKSGHYIEHRGGVGGYLVSYLLGTSEVNPLGAHYRCPDCCLTEFVRDAADGWDLTRKLCRCGREMCRDGHGLRFECYRRTVKQAASIVLAAGTLFYPDAKRILSSVISAYNLTVQEFEDPHPPNATIFIITDDSEKRVCSFTLRISDVLDECRALEKETNTSIDRVPYFSPEVLEAFKKRCTHKIPQFSSDFMKSLLDEVKPHSFSDLVKILGLAHGAGTWIGNAQIMIREGNKPDGLIAYYDDVFDFVQNKISEKGFYDTGFSYKVMENARRGVFAKEGLDKETKKLLSDVGISAHLVESMKKTRYLFPKSLGVTMLKQSMIMMWYKLNYPQTFEKIVNR